MVEVSEGEIQTTVIDHHGLVAAICQDLKIAERIDNRLPSGPQRKVSPGIASELTLQRELELFLQAGVIHLKEMLKRRINDNFQKIELNLLQTSTF